MNSDIYNLFERERITQSVESNTQKKCENRIALKFYLRK